MQPEGSASGTSKPHKIIASTFVIELNIYTDNCQGASWQLTDWRCGATPGTRWCCSINIRGAKRWSQGAAPLQWKLWRWSYDTSDNAHISQHCSCPPAVTGHSSQYLLSLRVTYSHSNLYSLRSQDTSVRGFGSWYSLPLYLHQLFLSW